MVVHDMLPLASIFVEPAKILFLNNAINHGIFSPLGIQQSHEMGKSIFFLIEANRVRVWAFCWRTCSSVAAALSSLRAARQSSTSGWYPRNLLPVRADEPAPDPGRYPRRYDWRIYPDYPERRSGFSGVSGFYPGRAGNDAEGRLLLANIAAICAAMAVSFVVSAILLKTSKVKEDDDIDAATRRMHDMKAESKAHLRWRLAT